jgi:hypothetical protein
MVLQKHPISCDCFARGRMELESLGALLFLVQKDVIPMYSQAYFSSNFYFS